MFVTLRSTLCEDPSTFFAGLVRSEDSRDEHFIDRDPTYFRYVLNWLRGVRVLPEEEQVLGELLWEADYYNLRDMSMAIQQKLKTLPPPWTSILTSIRDEMRQQ